MTNTENPPADHDLEEMERLICLVCDVHEPMSDVFKFATLYSQTLLSDDDGRNYDYGHKFLDALAKCRPFLLELAD